MKRQTDLQLIGYINKYGCFYMCIANCIYKCIHGLEPSYNFLNTKWMECIDNGSISGDVNKDGDMDDSDELLILDKDKLLKTLGLTIKYIGSFSPDVVIKQNQYAIGEFYNSKTKFTHFGVIDASKKVVYDPIDNSRTIREGVLKTVRIFG